MNATAAALAISALLLLFGAPGANAQTVQACDVAAPSSNCQGLWALQVDLVVPPGTHAQTTDPGCVIESQQDVLRVVRAARAAKAPNVAAYSGPLSTAVAGPIDEHLRNRGIAVGQLFSPHHKDGVVCATVAGVIPVRSFYAGYRLLVADIEEHADFRQCEPGSDCLVGSRFPVEPTMQRNAAINIVSVPFVNGPTERSRKARLIIFYKLLAGELPKTDLDNAGPTTAALPSAPMRRVPLEGAANFRDLGGYTTADGRHVKWGMLYRSDALDSLTPVDQRKIEALDIARITDFRAEREIRRRPDRLPPTLEARRRNVPLDYLPKQAAASAGVVASPAATKAASDEETLARIDRALMSVYPRFVRESRSEYGAWLKSLLEGSPEAAHAFHCTGGADRTGFATAILLTVLGVGRDQVMQDYLLTNQYLYSPEGRALLDKRTDGKLPDGVRVRARYLDAAFDAAIADYGTFDAYVRDGLGVDDRTLGRLREKFLE